MDGELFPATLDRKWCVEEMTKNQIGIMKETRKSFTALINECVTKCEPTVTLTFPKRLWFANRGKIALELINRFGEVKMVSLQGTAVSTKIGSNKEDIPNNIEAVIITFAIDN